MGQFEDLSTERMRQVMGSFCSGVTVITASTADGPVGFTCQSFTSLSMEPPLISFNPMKTSTSWPKIREVGKFAVNILADDQQHVSSSFARSGTDKFAGLEYSYSALGNPVIDGVIAWIDCTLFAEHEGGDHTIVISEVVNMNACDTSQPLLFFRGKYAAVADLATAMG